MLTKEMMRQIRRLQLRARRAVEDPLGGAYRSVFKGVGIVFEEVREYQPGDDIRGIDWNITARTGHPFIKRYIEERELTVFLVIDASASMAFTSQNLSKREIVAELCTLLSLCAVVNNDRVGMILCSDTIEKFVPPRKTTRHALRLIRDLVSHQPRRKATQLRVGLDFLNRIAKRRSLVFVLSDFLDEDYLPLLQKTRNRHDVIAIRVQDSHETDFPDVGLIQMRDAETGELRLVDTSDFHFRQAFPASLAGASGWSELSQRGATLDVTTDGTHVDRLLRFFKQRERRQHRHP